ncbi:flagellar basal body P-ring formation chaperone FlgA [Colwelliaceae bacterium 6471]
MTLDRDYIEAFAKSSVEDSIVLPSKGKMEITVSSIDPRINIQPCNSPLQANIPENHNGRNVNVKINCEDSTSWQLYIPVRIHTMLPVLVASMGIDKGTVLDSSNMTIEYLDQNMIRGEIIDEIELISGARAKRKISNGSPISKSNICLVCKGESVTIMAKSKQLTIKTAGIALKDGSLGEQISVKNRRSGKTVIGRVEALNKVVINL